MPRKPKTEAAPLPPEVPAVPVAEGTPMTLENTVATAEHSKAEMDEKRAAAKAKAEPKPLLPLEQEQAAAREKKPFFVVATFAANDHTSEYHAAKVVSHLSQIKVEAQIVRRVDGGKDLLVDGSLTLGTVTE
jgi:hypothetical protein